MPQSVQAINTYQVRVGVEETIEQGQGNYCSVVNPWPSLIDEGEVLRNLEANKKKSPKKSKFQQRLEEAAKQRGQKKPKR